MIEFSELFSCMMQLKRELGLEGTSLIDTDVVDAKVTRIEKYHKISNKV